MTQAKMANANEGKQQKKMENWERQFMSKGSYIFFISFLIAIKALTPPPLELNGIRKK